MILALKDDKNVSDFLLDVGFNENQLIKGDVFKNINLNLANYMQLRNYKFSLISKNCAGGLLYHRYGLEFSSPTINTFFSDEDFYKYVSDIRKYNNSDIVMFGDDRKLNGSEWGNIYGMIDDIKILFPHSDSKFSAYEGWLRRKQRISYESIFILSYADTEEDINRFSQVSYPDICITCINSNIKNTYKPSDISYSKNYRNVPFSMLNRLASGTLSGIDWISSLLSHQIVIDHNILYK